MTQIVKEDCFGVLSRVGVCKTHSLWYERLQRDLFRLKCKVQHDVDLLMLAQL